MLVVAAFILPHIAFADGLDTVHALPRFSERRLEEWHPHKDDVFIADVSANIGYLVHKNGDFLSFLIGSGKRKTVHYLGMTYDASTPIARWTVLSKQIQPDRMTFDTDGVFFRLYKGSDEDRTRYGIHSTRYGNAILQRDDRYASMGCILVDRTILDIVGKTFALDENMPVETVSSIDSSLPLLAQYIDWKSRLSFFPTNPTAE